MTRNKVFSLVPFCLVIFCIAGIDTDPADIGYSYDGFTSAINRGSPKLPFSAAVNQLPLWEKNRTLAQANSRATTLHGTPYPSLTASQAIGTRGHVLFQDFFLMDKLASFVRERIPERVVHAKGAGAHGVFEVTDDISKYTKAKFLNRIGKKTPVFVRFSTSVGEVGSGDTWVDPHGFATRFYTEDGNHDLVGNNIEVFLIRDPMIFPDLNRSRKRNPVTNMQDLNTWWDLISLRPESALHTLHLHSDIGRPDGFRRTDGFGVHAFKMVNAKGEVVFCKFQWRSRQPAPALTHEQASILAGTNPEYKTQDLFDAIARKDYPSWDLFVQIMTLDQIKNYPRNPFDITISWRLDEVPPIHVGVMTLNRNPQNYFAEVEQAGFQPNNMVPGIEPSPDRMLTARLFAYQDAQRYRLTTNGAQIPINRPLSTVTSYSRNGLACHFDNGGSSPNYYPNSFGGTEPDSVGAEQVSFSVQGIVDRYDIPEEDEHYEARLFVEHDIDDAQRERMIDAIGVRLVNVHHDVRERVLLNLFYPVSKQLGDAIREAIKRHSGKGHNAQHDSPPWGKSHLRRVDGRDDIVG